MKLFTGAGVLLIASIFSACQLPNGADIGGAVRDGIAAGVQAADRNQDGILTNREIKDSKNDPMFWTTIGGAVIGLLGLLNAKRAQGETNEQWTEIENLKLGKATE